jgi:hypothetical protein
VVATVAAEGWGVSDATAPDAVVPARVSASKEVGIARARASAVNSNGRKRGGGKGPTVHNGIWSLPAGETNVVLGLARRGSGTRL